MFFIIVNEIFMKTCESIEIKIDSWARHNVDFSIPDRRLNNSQIVWALFALRLLRNLYFSWIRSSKIRVNTYRCLQISHLFALKTTNS